MNSFLRIARRPAATGRFASTFVVALSVAAFAVGTVHSAPPASAQETQCAAGYSMNTETRTCTPISGGYSVPGGMMAEPPATAGHEGGSKAGENGNDDEEEQTRDHPGVQSPTHRDLGIGPRVGPGDGAPR